MGDQQKQISPQQIKLPEGNSSISVFSIISKNLRMNDSLFKEIWDMHPEDFGKVKMLGTEVTCPRWHQSYGKNYHFSGLNHDAEPIPKHPFFQELLNWVCNHSGRNYNQILVNWYQNGDHSIGPHSDDTKHLVLNSSIYSFSFGQERDFIVKSKKKDFKKTFLMKDNSLIIMEGEMQAYYTHSVPKRSLTKCPGKRINITFREFLENQEKNIKKLKLEKNQNH